MASEATAVARRRLQDLQNRSAAAGVSELRIRLSVGGVVVCADNNRDTY